MKNAKLSLPSMEHKIHLEVVGEESGINWVGDFVYRRPNLNERSLIELSRARLSGDLRTISQEQSDMNEALAHLRWTLKSFPDWWKESDFGGALFDGNVVIELYNKCIEFEASWREKVHGGKPESVEVKDGATQTPSVASSASQPQ